MWSNTPVCVISTLGWLCTFRQHAATAAEPLIPSYRGTRAWHRSHAGLQLGDMGRTRTLQLLPPGGGKPPKAPVPLAPISLLLETAGPKAPAFISMPMAPHETISSLKLRVRATSQVRSGGRAAIHAVLLGFHSTKISSHVGDQGPVHVCCSGAGWNIDAVVCLMQFTSDHVLVLGDRQLLDHETVGQLAAAAGSVDPTSSYLHILIRCSACSQRDWMRGC